MIENRDTGFCIGVRRIGTDAPPFLIAELSGNHNGSLERALAIVDAAAAAGAHAVKLQTYTADTMTIDFDGPGFVVEEPDSPWRGETLYGLYQKAHTPWEWHEALFKRVRDHGMLCFSTPFDATALEFLESLNCPFYKIASFENADLELIRKAAATGKPLILSTGMASLSILRDAVEAARGAGCRDLVLLKCTSTYPAAPADSNLATLPDLRRRFSCEAGLSDHTLGLGAAVAAVALGASVIEKHFTLSRTDGGVDAAFSLEPEEWRALATETRRAWEALGRVNYGASAAERGSVRFRRSLYVVKDVSAGEKFTADNLRAIRPGFGLPPKYRDAFLGEAALTDVKRGTPATWDLIREAARCADTAGKKVFFLTNADTPFSGWEWCEKHLPEVAVETGSELPGALEDYALIVLWNYRKLLPAKDLRPNFLVFHASDLPEGKGFATIYHAIALGRQSFTLTGFVPDAAMDEGVAVVKARFSVRPNETAPILRAHEEELCMLLVARVLERFGGKPPRGKKLAGEGSVFARRRPADNEIDVAKTFKELISHLRACESRHPAFFIHEGVKFLVSVTPETAPEFPRDVTIEFFDGN